MIVHPLESGARPHHPFDAAVPSIVVHGTIILFAVQLTAHASFPKPKPPEVIDVVHFDPAPRPGIQFATGQNIVEATQRSTSHSSVLPSVPLPNFHITIGVPHEPVLPVVSGGDFTTGLLTNHAAPSTQTHAATGASTLATARGETEVDRPVQPLSRLTPLYPEALRASGLQGTVLVQFVVDTVGRVEQGSFQALRSDNRLFTDAVRAAVEGMRFRPAEASGREVRQLVRQPFSFVLQ